MPFWSKFIHFNCFREYLKPYLTFSRLRVPYLGVSLIFNGFQDYLQAFYALPRLIEAFFVLPVAFWTIFWWIFGLELIFQWFLSLRRLSGELVQLFANKSKFTEVQNFQLHYAHLNSSWMRFAKLVCARVLKSKIEKNIPIISLVSGRKVDLLLPLDFGAPALKGQFYWISFLPSLERTANLIKRKIVCARPTLPPSLTIQTLEMDEKTNATWYDNFAGPAIGHVSMFVLCCVAFVVFLAFLLVVGSGAAVN